jgi:hypothetical protein
VKRVGLRLGGWYSQGRGEVVSSIFGIAKARNGQLALILVLEMEEMLLVPLFSMIQSSEWVTDSKGAGLYAEDAVNAPIGYNPYSAMCAFAVIFSDKCSVQLLVAEVGEMRVRIVVRIGITCITPPSGQSSCQRRGTWGPGTIGESGREVVR